MFPTIIQLSATEDRTLQLFINELHTAGFDISPLGGGDYSILAIPTGTEGANPEQMLQDILTTEETPDKLKSQIYTHIATKLSERAAIPYGQFLTTEECCNLLEQLFNLPTATFTPKGKKIYHILSDNELSKLFE